jgi:gliding motility-associated-like protein
VTTFPGITVNAGFDQSIIVGDQAQLGGTANQTGATYLWTPPTNLSATNILNPIASPQVTTTYTLTATSPQGCRASDDVVINVLPYCVKPMEAFSPNGDGINDLWLITNGSCLREASAQVFNRYGAKVFEDQSYKNNWDGTYNGKPLPDGTYYFVLSYRLINGKTVYLKGNVTILR